MKMVLLPLGEFTMGRTEEQLDNILTMIKTLAEASARTALGGQSAAQRRWRVTEAGRRARNSSPDDGVKG